MLTNRMRIGFVVLSLLGSGWWAALAVAAEPPVGELPKLTAKRQQLYRDWQRLIATNDLPGAEAVAEGIVKLDRSRLTIAQQELKSNDPLWAQCHDDLATALGWLAARAVDKDDHASAQKLRAESLPHLIKSLGEQHWRVTDTRQFIERSQLESRFTAAQQAQKSKCEELLSRAAKTMQAGDAIPLLLQGIDIRRSLYGEQNRQVGEDMALLAAAYKASGDKANAASVQQQALRISERTLGEEHPKVVQLLNNLGEMRADLDQFDAAQQEYSRCLRICERIFDADDLRSATARHNLAYIYVTKKEAKRAVPLLAAALETRKKQLGRHHPETLQTMFGLARAHLQLGESREAIEGFRQTLTGAKESLGRDHLLTLNAMNALAFAATEQGDYAQATALLEEGLAIHEGSVSKEESLLAEMHNNLALAYYGRGQRSKAELHMAKAVGINQQALGKDHPHTIASLEAIGTMWAENGEFKLADAALANALEATVKTFGANHARTATTISNGALLSYFQQKYDLAQSMWERALEITIRNGGAQSWDASRIRLNLAAVYRQQGELPKSWETAQQAIRSCQQLLEVAALSQSERQQLAMTHAMRGQLNSVVDIGISAKATPDDIYPYVVAWKGSVTARQRWQHLADVDDPEIKRDLDEIQAIAQQLSSLVFDPAADAQDRRSQTIAALFARKEEIELRLSRRRADLAQSLSSGQATVVNMKSNLAAGTALIDYLVITVRVAGEPDKPAKYERRLVAFVIERQSPIQLVSLGALDPIEQDLMRWREQLAEPHTSKVGDDGHRLREKIWDPVAKHLRRARTVLVSPDGPLGQVPFAAMPGKNSGTYLVEELVFGVLPTPQSVSNVRASSKPQPQLGTPSLLVVGDVDYDAADTASSTSPVLASRPGTPILKTKWAPLPGTAKEIDEIAGVFRKAYSDGRVQSLRGRHATSAAIRQTTKDRTFLHFSTHGFFIAPSVTEVSNHADLFQSMFAQHGAGSGRMHPSLRSGLVFAGANRGTQSAGGSIFTSLEVSEMDLQRSQLVVLSACETGLGSELGGEGILGLQRAFHVAGAQNVLASLWKVDDAATQALMTEFYTNLWERKLPPSDALRQAQLAMLVRYEPKAGKLRAGLDEKPIDEKTLTAARAKLKVDGELLPPFYWAAFVLSASGN